jgi:glutaminyl-peptide cyclotransferase
MAASMALSGDLKRVKAMILADMIGPANLKIKRDTNSTPWLTDLIWATAAQIGYENVFVNEKYPILGDDHLSFIRRGVPGCDLIDFSVPYWHTPQDTLDKVDPHSLASSSAISSRKHCPGWRRDFTRSEKWRDRCAAE